MFDTLLKFIKECQTNNESVCVGGDFNKTLGDRDGGLTRLCTEANLININHNRHRIDTQSFNTHKRGNKCIDCTLVDPRLAESVEACGHEPFNVRILGDHRGVHMDVHTAMSFGSQTPPLASADSRQLKSRVVSQTVPHF